MSQLVPVPVRRLDPELPLPAYAHPGDAGADLVAARDVVIPPGGRALVPTGLAIALPEGYVGLVHPRSGLAVRLGVTVLNAPGTVDAGYRGEIMVNLVNHDASSPAMISRGDRIAQLVVQRVERAGFHLVEELPASPRGAAGHGSTGGHGSLVSQHGASDERAPWPGTKGMAG
ncbi:dUTP diphosphatase [Plantactinospora sp. GCM10030261]|uniref:dUTP diphosphatase n=1 Tax=Plantactinospora sp. GCM10030261 TaxID=3273420 RepID=UPI003607D622